MVPWANILPAFHNRFEDGIWKGAACMCELRTNPGTAYPVTGIRVVRCFASTRSNSVSRRPEGCKGTISLTTAITIMKGNQSQRSLYEVEYDDPNR